jgi:hypothetical protein
MMLRALSIVDFKKRAFIMRLMTWQALSIILLKDCVFRCGR